MYVRIIGKTDVAVINLLRNNLLGKFRAPK